MCRVSCCWPMVVPSAALRQMRPHRLLRYVAKPARYSAFSRDWPLYRNKLRTWGGLVLELWDPKAVLRPQAGVAAISATPPAFAWTTGARPPGFGEPPPRNG